MTLYHLADAVTVTSANPVRIIDLPGDFFPPNTSQLFQFEINGTATCTGTFQAVGSLDPRTSLTPEGTGGAWSNIGAATTITCSTPGITPAVSTVSSAVPYTKFGVIISALSGTGAQASARLSC